MRMAGMRAQMLGPRKTVVLRISIVTALLRRTEPAAHRHSDASCEPIMRGGEECGKTVLNTIQNRDDQALQAMALRSEDAGGTQAFDPALRLVVDIFVRLNNNDEADGV